MLRLSTLLALAFVVVLIGCEADSPDTPPVDAEAPPEADALAVEDTDYADELDVDLETMNETESGLYYRDLEEGSGATAAAGDEVAVRYTGWLPDGSQFDSNVDAEDPLTFDLGTGAVIPGFDEGVMGMQVGGQRQIVIPADLAYGPQGAGPIPPNANLVFEIELVDLAE